MSHPCYHVRNVGDDRFEVCDCPSDGTLQSRMVCGGALTRYVCLRTMPQYGKLTMYASSMRGHFCNAGASREASVHPWHTCEFAGYILPEYERILALLNMRVSQQLSELHKEFGEDLVNPTGQP